MARQINRLSARTVQTLTKVGRHSDGGGLYLVVDRAAGDQKPARRWTFLYRDRRTQKLREMGLGGLASVSLARAREKAAVARAQLAAGKDPISEKDADDSEVPTFGAAADQLIESMEGSWKNEKHRAQWKSTLRDHCKPIRKLPVDKIETEDVLKVLQPLWHRVPETASRLRGRIERVLDAAKVKGHRAGENPARWRGHLDKLLPPRRRLTRGHHPAMAFAEVPAFIGELHKREALSAKALEFTILTAARTAETIGALWPEFDFVERTWTIPAHDPETGRRMKGGRQHVVPLSARCMVILSEMKVSGTQGIVFPGQDPDEPLSNMAMLTLLQQRMGRGDVTVHGFRSSFRDWAGDLTNFAREVVEAALAHQVGDETEQAYRRATALAKRRKLMDAWARYCEPRAKSNVVPLRVGGAS